MPTLKFKIGEAFPAGDPVARFVTVVAMMSNDWLREMAQMLEILDWHVDAEGRRVMSFRKQAASFHEATDFLSEARRRFPEVDAFVSGLSADARQEYDRVVAGTDPKSEHYVGDWLADHRHVTFHYARMHPDRAESGKEEISLALEAAADIEGTIAFEQNFGSVRFNFADEVAVQWLPDTEEKEKIAKLRDTVMALGRFAQLTAQAYLDSRPEGTFTVEP